MTAEPGDTPIARQTADLVGQGEAERVLLDAYRSGRLPHAWLITGPRGVGKATLAFRFARFLLAEGAAAAPGLFGAALPAESLAVPADSSVFRRVGAASHPDLFVVERRYDDKRDRLRSEIVVEDVRDLGQFLHLTPAEGGWRVAVIDSADEMNRNSANAVLKLLEEPPKRAVLLLVSHAPAGLLPTIRSRCRKLPLKTLGGADLAELLRRHVPELDEAERQALARLSEGSIGRALQLAAAGGLDLYRDLIGLLGQLPALDAAAAYKFTDRFGRKGQEQAFATAAELMAWWLGRAVRAGVTGQTLPEVVPGEAALASRLIAVAGGDRRGLDRWLDLWDKVARLVDRAEGANLDRKLVFLNALFGLEAAARG